jgi:hypothetical protein
MYREIPIFVLGALLLIGSAHGQLPVASSIKISTPPDSFFSLVRERDRDAARGFYTKYLDVDGIPIVASAEVADLALVRTREIVGHMLAGRPDVVQAMAANGMYLIIIGKDQVYTDMPEYRNHPNPAYQNERVRGTGGKPTSFGEENLLSLPLDRYDDESIAVHEFCHTIDGALRSIDPTWSERRNAAYENARRKGMYENTYTGSNPGEYWAEICQSYFDCNRVNNWNHGPVGTRVQLRDYDPAGYELVRTIFRLKPEQDWRYTFAQMQPSVIAPPPRFKIDPYYTKFTWAREFNVVGRGASDDALLKANDTIRKLFAYRHDILKAFMADGVKMVVLGRQEKLADLPELRNLTDQSSIDLLARSLDYHPFAKLLVVAEENVAADPRQPNIGDNQVIRGLARAIHQVAGLRPVDPEWDNRPRNVWQQYELRLQRLDVRFDERLKQVYDQAIANQKWRGTSAANDRGAYWATGVLAYFDARGQDAAPAGADHPVVSREALKAYDSELYALVHETFAYASKVDWRFQPELRAKLEPTNRLP